MHSADALRSETANALVGAALIDEPAARRIVQIARSTGEPVAAIVHKLALADDNAVLRALTQQSGLQQAAAMPDAALDLAGVNPTFLRRHRVLPLGWAEDRLLVGVIDPEASDGLAALAFAVGCATEPRLMSASAQQRAFDTLYAAEPERETAPDAKALLTPNDTNRIRDLSDAGPAVRIVDALFDGAIEQNASDIHIEPLSDRVRIRFRVDGELITAREEPAQLAPSIAARIKILADMDVADRRSPQDGRTSFAAKGRPIDVRISSVPSAYGETIALRLLRRDASLLSLPALGFSRDLLAMFEHALALRRGLFLITGPTGSGKTTSLYAMLERLRDQALKILSVEDPIEYYFNDVTQTQVNEDAGLSFASALRSFLRQDPDVILVGEIRDAETARIAVQAALTGHLVLATLHTVDAPRAIPRLIDMGVDRYLVAATLSGVISQRLVRRLCAQCKTARAPTGAELSLLGVNGVRSATSVAEPNGCGACRGSGFSGRIVAAEGFIATPAIRDAISAEGDGGALERALQGAGYASIAASAAHLVTSGEIAPSQLQLLCLA